MMQSDPQRPEELPTLMVGPGRVVCHANAAAETLFGRPGASLTQLAMDELVPAERRGELRNVDDVLAGGSARRLRSAIRLTSGQRLDVAVTINPIRDAKGEVSMVTIVYEPARSSAEWLRTSIRAEPLRASIPPARRSEQRLSPAPRPTPAMAKLTALDGHLAWLERRMTQPTSIAPLDDAGERARVLLVLSEMRALSEGLRNDLCEPAAGDDIPTAPKVPRF